MEQLTEIENIWTKIDDMDVDDINIIKTIKKKESYIKKKKFGKGNAVAGYRNAYNLYSGSKVFQRVTLFVSFLFYNCLLLYFIRYTVIQKEKSLGFLHSV